MHKDLQDIPSEYFKIWGDTLGNQRGLPHFRQLPEYVEEGILIPSAEGYTYQTTRKIMAPHMRAGSQLSPSRSGQVELTENPSVMALSPSQNQYETCALSYPAPWQQIPWIPAPSTSSQIYDDQPSGEDSPFDVDCPISSNHPHPQTFPQSPNYVFAIADPSAMTEIEQTHPRTIYTAPDCTSIPHNTQWNPHGPISLYAEVQSSGHDVLMASHQPDIQMAEIFDLVFSTPPYSTNNTGGDISGTFGTYNASLQ